MAPKKKKNKKKFNIYSRRIIIAAAIFWIAVGALGMLSTFNMAKDWHRFHIYKLENNKHLASTAPVKVTQASDRTVDEDIRASGLDRSPYLFSPQLRTANIIFALTIMVSFFVLFSINKIAPDTEKQSDTAKS